MPLPASSNLSYVGRLRYIQSIHEAPPLKGPDYLAGQLLPTLERWRCTLLPRKELHQLQSQAFYYYLLARTMHYDETFTSVLARGARHIVNIGCGTDTRAHRYADALAAAGADILECDLPPAIERKRRMARSMPGARRVEYLPLDLHDDAWPGLDRWLERVRGESTAVIMEGVTPYVDESAIGRFLDLLARNLTPGSRLAYDFKLQGVADDFGRGGRALQPFRLPDSRDQVSTYHGERGSRLLAMEHGWELTERLLPGVARAGAPLFRQDCLVQVEVR